MKYQTGLSYRGKGGHKSSGLLLTSKGRVKYQTGLSYREREDISLADCCLHRRPGRVKYQTGLSYRGKGGHKSSGVAYRRPGRVKYQTGLSYRGKGGHESSGLLLTSKARSCEVSDRTQL